MITSLEACMAAAAGLGHAFKDDDASQYMPGCFFYDGTAGAQYRGVYYNSQSGSTTTQAGFYRVCLAVAAPSAPPPAPTCDCSCHSNGYVCSEAGSSDPISDQRCASSCAFAGLYCYDGGNANDDYGCDASGDEAGPCCGASPPPPPPPVTSPSCVVDACREHSPEA